jgi:DNA polymerase
MAGQLLNKILASIGFEREDVYIANIIKSRPPGNRTPERFEVEQCMPYLLKQLELIQPRFILALGLTAANSLLNLKSKMSELRGKVHDFHGIQTIVTYHPAALLRNSQWKRPTWDDVRMLRGLYDEWKATSEQ